jgi:hypothetical protein
VDREFATAPLTRVESVIREFNLLPSRDVLVACSGGKDSTYACLALRELGYDVYPLMVDMGYSRSWAGRVAENLRSLGFSPICIRARSASQIVAVDIAEPSLLQRNLDIVSQQMPGARFTACTGCYNSKVLVMLGYISNAIGPVFDRIVFGHHATDVAASLLKSALMYIDRWDRGNVEYDPERFRRLAAEFREAALRDTLGAFSRVGELVSTHKASTDEPPVQDLVAGSDASIVRPLFDVWEYEIEADRRIMGKLEASGCGHTSSASTQTPREIVQYEIIKALESGQISGVMLMALVRDCITEEGRLFANARRMRAELLGEAYKPGYRGMDKL